MPGPTPGRANGRVGVAVLVVCLAVAAVAYVAWLQMSGAAVDSARGTASGVTGVRVTTPARTGSSSPVRKESVDPVSRLPWVDVAALPPQARTVLAQIDRGGPYAYDKDGTVFRNAEGLLPKAASGFYKEYTVVLPGSDDRGPARIIVGGRSEFFYWTTDHYVSFSRIRR